MNQTSKQIINSLVESILHEIDPDKVKALYDRPGTPGEKQAALAALQRMGHDPTKAPSPEHLDAYHKILTNFNYKKWRSTDTHSLYTKQGSSDDHLVRLDHPNGTVSGWTHQTMGGSSSTKGKSSHELFKHMQYTHTFGRD